MKKIFYIIFSFISITANAQYTEYFKWTDVRTTCLYNVVFADVLIKDSQILSANKVNGIITRDESGAVLNMTTVNREGLITEYITKEYNDGRKIKYDMTYDADGRIQILDYIEEGQY